MAEVDAISEQYVERFAALHPVGATMRGITGHDDRMTDYSPDGIEERTLVDRATLARLRAVVPADDRDRVARDVMIEQLDRNVALADAGEHFRTLNVLASPLQHIRGAFDLVATETAEEASARRLRIM